MRGSIEADRERADKAIQLKLACGSVNPVSGFLQTLLGRRPCHSLRRVSDTDALSISRLDRGSLSASRGAGRFSVIAALAATARAPLARIVTNVYEKSAAAGL